MPGAGADGQRIARLAISISIGIGIFGLTPAEIVVGGGKATACSMRPTTRANTAWAAAPATRTHLAARGLRMRGVVQVQYPKTSGR